MDILDLFSARYRVVDVIGKTRADGFKHVRTGDVIQLRIRLSRRSTARGRQKPTYVEVVVDKANGQRYNSVHTQTRTLMYLANFDLQLASEREILRKV